MDVVVFFIKWLKDLYVDQLENGGVFFVIFDVLCNNGVFVGWGDVVIIIFWDLYEVYGDMSLLFVQYFLMKVYVEFIWEQVGDFLMWKGGSVFGDWLFYKFYGNNYIVFDGYIDLDMIVMMFFVYFVYLFFQVVAVLGKMEDEQEYWVVYEVVKGRF